MQTLQIRTERAKQVIDITSVVNNAIRTSGLKEGVCTIFVAHTTCGVSTAVLDPGTDLDYLDALTQLIPALDFRHPHNPAHTPDHILATLVGPSVAVPVSSGRLVLGTWQRAVLFEFDGPRARTVVLTFTADNR